MIKTMSALTTLLLFAAFFGTGYFAMPLAVEKWRNWFPAPAFTEGDFSAHYSANRLQVVLYGTRSCVFCQRARDYFIAQKIAFTDQLIDSPGEAAKSFAPLNIATVPVILIGNRMISGFNPKAIDEALTQLQVDRKQRRN
jgi:mycoredoxin